MYDDNTRLTNFFLVLFLCLNKRLTKRLNASRTFLRNEKREEFYELR